MKVRNNGTLSRKCKCYGKRPTISSVKEIDREREREHTQMYPGFYCTPEQYGQVCQIGNQNIYFDLNRVVL